ncbi:MAG: alpha-ketoglutarate-dependent dioxygenase AlkB [Bacteroidia bacterium]|nr:alpha-ketoglutarate-dependent dioxygenase AlkB [Bacteroidia bacterium]
MTHANLLPRDGEVILYADFVNQIVADQWFNLLLKEIEWQQQEIMLFGKKIKQPRLSAWYGDEKTAYTYSGLTLEPIPFFSGLTDIKNKIEQVVGTNFNSVLLNLYRCGNDSMGWHSDNEKELGLNPIIASLSLGSTRNFNFRHRNIKGLHVKSKLTHGSLLLMQDKTQHYWQHSLPKTKATTTPRINLTFRRIV